MSNIFKRLTKATSLDQKSELLIIIIFYCKVFLLLVSLWLILLVLRVFFVLLFFQVFFFH